MKKFARLWPLALTILLLLAPQQVGAYSYGDPSKEIIAEAMNEMIAKLPESAPDWAAVGEIYKVHRPEIESHFGASVAATLDADIAAKDRERFLSNYKALLVLNLDRRFQYANKDVNDYAQAKLLLAKAKGTYDVLQPYVGDDATNAAVLAAFEEALTALGNPGLFGVGEKPVDPETFRTKTDFILGKMKPLFPFRAAPAEKPAAAEPAPKPQPAATEPAKAAEPAKTEPKVPAAVETKSEEPAKPAEPEAQAPAAAEPAAEAPEPEAPAAEAPAEAEVVEPEPSPTEAPAAEETEAEAEPVAVTSADVSSEAAAHAPMERQSRTNPIVSIVVIGAVALAAAGGIFYAKKRNLF
ncbi:hypothetical protein [Paenibacillus sp.]|uniref:hypothetical protein n=1 Tax=Paenibacillus sp. TaxID=58172 RepID=UPI002D75AB0E|nr:hypothetical protein [Paenibacillus sp.]HZG54889.1 hypothetical protein [Paenibacillus sp.]